jgi:SAM-dependent methyltransferase
MCHSSCIAFGLRALGRDDVEGKRVIEVGSRDLNGSLRPVIEALGPSEYVGVDVVDGTGVDLVCDGGHLVERFGTDAFDLVVSTEVLEHARDWRGVISRLKRVCRPGGLLVLTTRSRGFPYHAWPSDFWRYELDDMRQIFGDLEILLLEPDRQSPGVFLKARRPPELRERDLSAHRLFSVVTGTFELDITDVHLRGPRMRVIDLLCRSRAFAERLHAGLLRRLGV